MTFYFNEEEGKKKRFTKMKSAPEITLPYSYIIIRNRIPKNHRTHARARPKVDTLCRQSQIYWKMNASPTSGG